MLSNRDQLALHMVCAIAKSKKAIAIPEIQENVKYSISYLEKVAKELRLGGIIKGVRGPGGGYVLARKAENILLTEVIFTTKILVQPLEGSVLVEGTEEFIRERLQSTTLSDLLGQFDWSTD